MDREAVDGHTTGAVWKELNAKPIPDTSCETAVNGYLSPVNEWTSIEPRVAIEIVSERIDSKAARLRLVLDGEIARFMIPLCKNCIVQSGHQR